MQRTYNDTDMIKSVDGKEDTKSIVDFVNNKFLRDTRAFKIFEGTSENEYGVWVDNPRTGVKEKKPIPMGVGFFENG